MPEQDPELFLKAEAFASEVAELLQSTVTDDAPVRAHQRENRIVVAALDEDGGAILFPLEIAGQPVACLRVEYECVWDVQQKYLAIEESRFALLGRVIAEPILRFEYVRDETRPGRAAHVHAHGECTQLGPLLAAAGVVTKANLQRLHLPVGGKRFRPCLEDVIEFLVDDLKVDAKPGWQGHVAAGRARWNALQLAAAMRKYENESVDVLRRFGYTVIPPE